MNHLEQINRISVPLSVVDKTTDFLRFAGRDGSEGIVLWVGEATGKLFSVRRAIVPRQRAYRAGGGVCVIADDDFLANLNRWLFETEQRLLVQVHSHPGRAFHSDADDVNAIVTTIGSLSIVVPDFAAGPFLVPELAVYRLTRRGWERLSVDVANRLIQLEE